MLLRIDGKSLTLEQIEKFISDNVKIQLTAESKKRVRRARALVDKWDR